MTPKANEFFLLAAVFIAAYCSSKWAWRLTQLVAARQLKEKKARRGPLWIGLALVAQLSAN